MKSKNFWRKKSMVFGRNSSKVRTLVLVLIIVCTAVAAGGYVYHSRQNRSVDPRIMDARKKMAQYNDLVADNRLDQALVLLDQVEQVYRNTPGYADSFELGVITNNKGSVFLIKTETDLLNHVEPDPEHLRRAKQFINQSITLYTGWLERVTPLTRDRIYRETASFFNPGDPVFKGFSLKRIVEKRVDDIMLSKLETRRRLSVSFTNLGIICRYEKDPECAKKNYETALSLWEDNHVAQNNLNRLLGRPVEKRSIIQQMFPKKRITP